jgi:hypothetical protein
MSLFTQRTETLGLPPSDTTLGLGLNATVVSADAPTTMLMSFVMAAGGGGFCELVGEL